MCDFEANSLATGLNLEHPNLGEGRRFVTDARFAPIAGGSMDLVVFKEFVHHVADYRPLFREANRVLRHGGTMALMEPVQSAWTVVRELRQPNTHEGHHFAWPDSYLRAIRRAGMEIVYQAPVYASDGNTRPLAAWMKRRALAAIDDSHPPATGSRSCSFACWAEPTSSSSLARRATCPRPSGRRSCPIDPATRVTGADELASYAEFPAVLASAAERLKRLPSAAALP